MIKKFILPICLLFSLISFAQEGTSSPYSFYGIGDVKFKGTAENRAMGGLTIFSDTIHANFQNPASYSSLKWTTLAMGGSYLTTKLKTATQEEKARRTTMDYLSIGLPMGKLGVGFGLVPYSAVGYKIRNVETDINNVETIKKYTGTGGINKAFLGAGYAISSKLNVGIDVSYNFGKIETSSLYFIENVQDGTREKNFSNIKGVNFTTGLTYKSKINNKLSFLGSLTFSPESKLKSYNERKIAILPYIASGAEVVLEGNEIDVAVENTTLKLPTKLSLGAGIGELKKWMLGTEITFQQSSNLGNRFNDIDNVRYENAIKYNVGGYFIPNYNSFSNYWNKIVYRGGLRYENTGLIIENESINDIGMTLGLGLPLYGTFSNINIGFEYGKRGTTNANLVQENYSNITIGLSFNDKWFTKRLYN